MGRGNSAANSDRVNDSMVGRRFERLVVQQRESSVGKASMWMCQCDCGEVKVVRGTLLRRGVVRSCGCLRHEPTKHGHTVYRKTTAEHRAWSNMITRCTNPKRHNYPYYGGRGITVCDRWLHSFEAFLEDMGPKPSSKHSLDRIDSDGHYSPGNCKWSTHTEQVRNRRIAVRLTWDGRTQTIAEWAEELGFSYNTLQKRVGKGWSAERTLTKPAQKWARRELRPC